MTTDKYLGWIGSTIGGDACECRVEVRWRTDGRMESGYFTVTTGDVDDEYSPRDYVEREMEKRGHFDWEITSIY